MNMPEGLRIKLQRGPPAGCQGGLWTAYKQSGPEQSCQGSSPDCHRSHSSQTKVRTCVPNPDEWLLLKQEICRGSRLPDVQYGRKPLISSGGLWNVFPGLLHRLAQPHGQVALM